MFSTSSGLCVLLLNFSDFSVWGECVLVFLKKDLCVHVLDNSFRPLFIMLTLFPCICPCVIRLRGQDRQSHLLLGSQTEGQSKQKSFLHESEYSLVGTLSYGGKPPSLKMNELETKYLFPHKWHNYLSVLQYNGSSHSRVWSAHGWNDWTAAAIPGEKTLKQWGTKCNSDSDMKCYEKSVQSHQSISAYHLHNEISWHHLLKYSKYTVDIKWSSGIE